MGIKNTAEAVEGEENMNPKSMGKKLKELRGKRSVTEVAKAVNVSHSSISMYEIGERIPRDDVKIKLAKYFGVSVESIFFAD